MSDPSAAAISFFLAGQHAMEKDRQDQAALHYAEL
jgi:hypothetical protein